MKRNSLYLQTNWLYLHFCDEQLTVAVLLGFKFGENQQLSRSYSVTVVIILSLFVLAFGWSWGPLGWTVPSEIFPLEVRSAGQSITVAVNLLVTFIIAQCFLSLLCFFQFGIFLFFAAWTAVMTIFVLLFLPETKGIPIEEMSFMWKRHWFWKRILIAEDIAEESTPGSRYWVTSLRCDINSYDNDNTELKT